jgi:hypothetical protein
MENGLAVFDGSEIPGEYGPDVLVVFFSNSYRGRVWCRYPIDGEEHEMVVSKSGDVKVFDLYDPDSLPGILEHLSAL